MLRPKEKREKLISKQDAVELELHELWKNVAVAVAGSSNCVREASAGKFATQAVKDYIEFCIKLRKEINECD